MSDLKTLQQWMRQGRRITKGSQAELYRVNDDRTEARALFTREQTSPMNAPDDSDDWTVTISAQEWEEIKAQKRALNRGRPRVKIRRGAQGGAEVWCGPDADIIALLKARGFTYQPQTHYWRHLNKDAEATAAAFAAGKIRDRPVTVVRDWEQREGVEL